MKGKLVDIHNGLELFDYIHAGKWPAIRIQYRINKSESNVIGWISYGEKSKIKYTRQQAIEKAREKATIEEFDFQKLIFNPRS